MKKILRYVFAVSLFLLPALALAASNDVSLTTSAVISVGGFSLNISGATASVQSIVVRSSNFDVTLLPGSSIAITSIDKKNFNFDISAPITQTFSCGSSSSTLTVSAVSATVTLTITPTGTCGVAVVAANAGNGAAIGGGGGGGYVAVLTTPSTNTGSSPTSTSGASGSTGSVFSGDFGMGAKGDSVIKLQTFLEGKGFLKLPKGATKGLYGAMTKKAVKAYQKSKGIGQTGYLGPKTRAAIAAEK